MLRHGIICRTEISFVYIISCPATFSGQSVCSNLLINQI